MVHGTIAGVVEVIVKMAAAFVDKPHSSDSSNVFIVL